MEFGQVASTASGSPFSPSQHTIKTSWIPRLAKSAHTEAQNDAPSLSSDPQSQNALDAIYINANCHITGLVDYAVAIADFHAPKGGGKMVANIAHGHPTGVQRDDHVVEFF